MTFIHGELSWSAGEPSSPGGVPAMLDALSGHAWCSSGVEIASTGRSRCVLAHQSSRAGETPHASVPGGGLHVLADLRIDERDERVGRASSAAGATSTPMTDAELVLDTYRTSGLEAARAIVGDGAFALWDEHRQRLLCWRDAVGSRPLYFHHAPRDRFVFSSDLRSLCAHDGVPVSLDLAYARALLEVGPAFQHPERTLVAGVHKLPAGHLAVVDPHGCEVRRFWWPGDVKERHYKDHSEYVDELRELVSAAVTRRLPATPGPIGVHVSGGLDSSSIAVLAQRALDPTGRRAAGISWAPPRRVVPPVEGDERPLVEAVAAFGNVPTRFCELRTADLLELARRDIALQPITTLDVETSASRDLAAAGCSIVLSGWGGDEFAVFNGRGYFADLARRGRWLTLQRELRLRSDIQDASLAAAVRGRVVLPLVPNRLLAHTRPEYCHAPSTLPSSLRPEFRRELESVDPLPFKVLREVPGVRRNQYALLANGHLQYRMESWASHGARLGIEYAFPLLDRHVVEFALSVPDHLYFKNGWKRWLYRTAMAGILPDNVRWQPLKEDGAMNRQIVKARAAAWPALRDDLRARSDNGFVDVERLIASVSGTTGSDQSADQSRDATEADNWALWLAFTTVPLA